MPDETLDGLSVERRTERWTKILKDPGDVYHSAVVAELNHKIIGFANIGREQEGDPVYRGELFAIYVLKEFQGHGVGRALVKRSALGLLAMEISSMLVWALTSNPYQKFYEALGGVFLRDRIIQFGAQMLHEKAYGWKDIRPLTV